ncbi:TPA: hypothetical protein HH295_20400 [Xanthomonas vasicola pv. zeae]|uniref:Uncharacterized protein n=2 Tax=Xanthomonas vasicola TaxID=56459 RepID=A0ABD7S2N9_XANVA|nr:hypothetical protein [Xanthomonas vasicola]MBV6746844.1 hypothetical protein [Xanthomonas vasicola pv. vasculorum NCPPB 890]AZR29249.1 hypothetical protein KWO_000375 [Xanthomonas vasicola pv. musacearum NCPPB 4379]MBV6743850.1 hypothetical protein [Xanthomonas vasicola pv. musacearum NCPPB 2251]MBV6892220.1 hypothetical protein [Xanthomonas vasicola pv. vasculorum]MBV7280184.1 hypothetical protein [Xanthomonas vasicola pv. musacearum]
MSSFISPASAAVLGNVTVYGSVLDDTNSSATAPSNKAVYKYLWNAGWSSCTATYPATRSLALTGVVARQGQSNGYWPNVVAYWDCKNTP